MSKKGLSTHWQFIDFKDTREFKHNIRKKYVVKRNN